MASDHIPQPSPLPHPQQSASATRPGDEMFTPRAPERASVSLLPWVIAGVVVLAIAGILLVIGHSRSAGQTQSVTRTNTVLPLDPYAPSLAIDGLQMSESTSLSGGKSTFIDGRIRNNGSRTLTGATVQVLFANDEALPPQVETLSLAIIRTREPYIDTQPLSAAPLAPGSEREFRLIFEDIRTNWNQQLPEIHVVKAVLR